MESPIKVFSNWVLSGKDEGMEKNHSASVENMIEYSTKGIDNFSFCLLYTSPSPRDRG